MLSEWGKMQSEKSLEFEFGGAAFVKWKEAAALRWGMVGRGVGAAH
jgi:hypothetical protein